MFNFSHCLWLGILLKSTLNMCLAPTRAPHREGWGYFLASDKSANLANTIVKGIGRCGDFLTGNYHRSTGAALVVDYPEEGFLASYRLNYFFFLVLFFNGHSKRRNSVS